MLPLMLSSYNSDHRREQVPLTESIRSSKDLAAAVSIADRNTIWISEDSDRLIELTRFPLPAARRFGRIVLLHSPQPESLPMLMSLFETVAFSMYGGFLPPDELSEALAAEHRDELFIGGSVDRNSETITLWRGDLTSIVVPFSTFPPSGDGTAPDFDRFAVTDYGQSVALGDYEAAADAILYEHDPVYRRRLNRERLESEQGFGPSIRRLRLQRGLRREDFKPLAAKTIARIEQGKTDTLHARTKATLARILQVPIEELGSF